MAAKSCDPCPQCKCGKLLVASSQRQGEYQIRYLRCRICGCTDKHVLPGVEVRRLKAAG